MSFNTLAFNGTTYTRTIKGSRNESIQYRTNNERGVVTVISCSPIFGLKTHSRIFFPLQLSTVLSQTNSGVRMTAKVEGLGDE